MMKRERGRYFHRQDEHKRKKGTKKGAPDRQEEFANE